MAEQERGLFVLVGEITEGMVHIGMHVTLRGSDEVFSARVHGVEFVTDVGRDPEGSEPALTFSYRDPEKLERWLAVDWPGKELNLGW